LTIASGLANTQRIENSKILILVPLFSFRRLQDLASGGLELGPPNIIGAARDGHIPAVYSYSLGVQRELGFDTVVDVAYVATLSRHLAQGRNLNAIPYGTTFTREAQDPSRYPGGVAPDAEPNLAAAYRQASSIDFGSSTGIFSDSQFTPREEFQCEFLSGFWCMRVSSACRQWPMVRLERP